VAYGEPVATEQIIFVGGPLDGLTKDVEAGLGAFEVPLESPDGVVAHHRYAQADLAEPEAAPFSSEGLRRYVYLGQAKTF
jgi:hypothetical protein